MCVSGRAHLRATQKGVFAQVHGCGAGVVGLRERLQWWHHAHDVNFSLPRGAYLPRKRPLGLPQADDARDRAEALAVGVQHWT